MYRKMRKSNKLAVVLLLTVILLVGCRPNDGAITPTTTPVEIPTLLPSVTMPIPSLTPTIKSAQLCEELVNDEIDDSQITYQGIIPGVTTAEEVEDIMGEPEEIERLPDSSDKSKEEVWHFENVNIRVNRDGHVQDVEVFYFDLDIPNKPRLLDIIQSYGCPDAVYAIDDSQHPSGHYLIIDLIYVKGLLASFFSNPIKLSQESDYLLFFKSMSLDEYVSIYKIYQNPLAAKEITWENAVEAP